MDISYNSGNEKNSATYVEYPGGHPITFWNIELHYLLTCQMTIVEVRQIEPAYAIAQNLRQRDLV